LYTIVAVFEVSSIMMMGSHAVPLRFSLFNVWSKFRC
jgi:hypothetical protein